MTSLFEMAPMLAGLKRKKAGALLIIGQIALSLALIANALSLIHDRLSLSARPSGVADELRLFRVTAVLADDLPEKILADKKRDRELIAAVPGVESVAISNSMPVSRRNNTSVQLRRVPDDQTSRSEASVYISPNSLLETLQLRLVKGRDFLPGEVLENKSTDTGPRFGNATILTQALAKRMFGDAEALGQSVEIGGPPLTVVGIVERLQRPRAQAGEAGEYSMILPILSDRNLSTFLVRTRAGERNRVMRDVEEVLRRQDRRRVVEPAVSLEADRVTRYSAETALAGMLIAVTVLLLLVTASGIVGLVSLWVNQQRRQIGVRRALGARKRDIVWMFLQEMTIISSLGVVLGSALGFALNEWLVRQLEATQMGANYVWVGAASLFVLSVLAVWGPARRAASISPAIATRMA